MNTRNEGRKQRKVRGNGLWTNLKRNQLNKETREGVCYELKEQKDRLIMEGGGAQKELFT